MRLLYIFFAASLLFACSSEQREKQNDPSQLPEPTIIKWDMEEGGKSEVRKNWQEMIHRHKPGTDWRQMDGETLAELRRMRAIQRAEVHNRDEESFAEGSLKGEWEERGSKNQAGNLVSVTYERIGEEDLVYGVSAGGTVWRGGLLESNWQALNDDIRFNNSTIEVIETEASTRIIVPQGKTPYFSDDEGATWTEANGFEFYDGWGTPIALREVNGEVYYLVFTWDGQDWESQMWLYYSKDGQNYEKIHVFEHNHNSWDARRFTKMWQTIEKDGLYIFHLQDKLYRVDSSAVSLIDSSQDIPTTIVDFEGIRNDESLTFYTLTSDQNVYQSTDTGKTWILKGDTPVSPWGVGIGVSARNPDNIFMGAVNAFKSNNGGQQWELVNEWWEYYGEMNKLHADIMDMRSFEHPLELEFTLIANHGGLQVSFDDMETTENIGLEGLNISQYYDVVTDPTDPNYIYAGTQDQGHQRTNLAAEEGAVHFDQVISGDYGHYAFSRGGRSLWILYPFGSVQYYHDPQNSGPQSNFNIIGDDDPNANWIYPTEETPDLQDNDIFIAGGNINGGPGSYLITLSAEPSPPYEITATQFDYDFLANSNNGQATISAIEASEIDDDRLYVSTNDGSFFYSTDYGTNWTRTPAFAGPGEHWLYGADIYASRITSDLLWFGGSGYNNPAVFVSDDGGQSFLPMSEGLPNTLVHEIAANDEETLLFAATVVGPYVCVLEEQKWYPMMGVDAPLQEYYSVEYVPGEELVRFGTHGRGIWDFNISYQPTTVASSELQPEQLEVFPNPVSTIVNVTIPNDELRSAQLFDLSGRLVMEYDVTDLEDLTHWKLDLSRRVEGEYILRLTSDKSVYTSKLLKI